MMTIAHPGVVARLQSIGAISLVAIVLAGCDASALDQARRSADTRSASELAMVATPAGITIQPLGKAQGYGLDKESATLLPRDQIAYTDAKGMTLYTYEKDPPGKSACTGECAAIWPPALASAGAKPLGEWTLIARDDGAQQWALSGKPLYTYIKDVDVGSVGGNSPKRVARGPGIGPRGAMKGPRPQDIPLPEGWRPALIYPVANAKLPVGFAIKEVPDALGLVLVDAQGQTLYAFDGEPNEDSKACVASGCNWTPLAAPLIATPLGDFDFLVREDGIRQWTWHGKALYTYKNDFAPGDANGVGVDKNWHVAQVVRYFMPSDVKLQETPRLGKILATAQGKTLYRRDGFIFQSGSGHNLRRGIPVRPAVGRDLGTDPRCVNDCSKDWSPFLAPADAQPSAYWDVYTRADGSKQWVYQGYALWTYAGDKKPGDMTANDSFEIAISQSPQRMVDIGTPYDGPTALYWSVGVP